MADLVVRAPAKINLHLEVLGLRPDGFHELAMVMQTIDLCDELVLAPAADARIQLSCDRPELPIDASNLIVRAGELLRERVGLPELGARINLRKRIPIGAGLAGGSSDGAAALAGLNALWGLGLPAATLQAMAAELGSDMPYCLVGGTRLCFGRGEQLEASPHGDASGLGVLLIKHPQCSVSTPWAYGRCRAMREDYYLAGEEAFAQRRAQLRGHPLLAALAAQGPWPPLRNDLQTVVAPEVESVSTGLALLRHCADSLALAMSGSGPSLFAVFANPVLAAQAAQQLAEPLREAGFEHWICTTTGSGVRVVSDD